MHSDSRFSLSTLPWFLGPLLFGCLSLYLGQDANWDLRNYHFYNAYSFLFHRFDFDVAPAQVATFYNPLLYIPFYELVTRLSPRMVGCILGALQGLNFPILIGIARCTLSRDTLSSWRYYAVGLIGVLGAGNISETGTMFADNLLSLLILASLWLLLANARHLTERRLSQAFCLIGFAGFLMGLAAGFKQPAAVFAVGWCLAFLFIPASVARRILLAFFFGIGVLAGIAASGGYWMYFLWSRFANPLFPYFNQFFHSSMASAASYRDARFLPAGLKDALLFPFLMVSDPHRTAEIVFRDIRFAVFSVVLMITFLYVIRNVAGLRRIFRDEVKAGSSAQMIRTTRLFLLTGALVSYVVWLRLFGIYRYILPLEMLAPLGIYLLIQAFPWRSWLQNAVVVGCAILILSTLRPGNWGRVNWGESYFGFKAPPVENPDQAMVLLTGMDPTAYVIPFFPPAVRFVRIQSYFTGPKDQPNGYDLLIGNLIAKQQGPLYVLYRSYEKGASVKALDTFRLAIDPGSCRELRPHIEEHLKAPLDFCALTRMNSSNGRRQNQ
jgi:hypothetical protein